MGRLPRSPGGVVRAPGSLAHYAAFFVLLLFFALGIR